MALELDVTKVEGSNLLSKRADDGGEHNLVDLFSSGESVNAKPSQDSSNCAIKSEATSLPGKTLSH